MAKKQKYVCGNCRQEVKLTDEACPHCKAALEPIEDAARKPKNFGSFGGVNVSTDTDGSLILKQGTEVIRLTNPKWMRTLARNIVKAADSL